MKKISLWHNSSLAQRVLRVQIFIFIFIISILAYTFYSVRTTSNEIVNAVSGNEIKRNVLETYNAHLKRLNSISKYVADSSYTDFKIDPDKCEFSQYIHKDEVKTFYQSNDSSELIFETIKNEHDSLYKYIKILKSEKDLSKRMQIYKSHILPSSEIIDSTINLSKSKITDIDIIELTLSRETNARKIVFTALFIFIIVIVFMSYYLIKRVTVPVKRLKDFALSVAEGDLTQTVPIHGNDELAELSETINQMVIQLQNVMEGISESVDSFVAVSEQMKSNSLMLSEGASEQAASVEEVSATMEEMMSNIEQNTMNASRTEEIAFTVTEDAENGRGDMKKSAEMLKKIAEKISIITDISFQTNILSLNASIEAARAGQFGKGFAVVAQEVGNLADKSKASAEEIEDISEGSIKIADRATALLEKLVDDIQKTYDLIVSITTASSEQRDGASQVNISVQELNDVTQQNAAAAEELAINAEELSSNAELVKEMVSFFKLESSYTQL